MARNFKKAKGKLYSGAPALKWIVLAISIVIGTVSIIYTNRLVGELKFREKRQVDLYAKALEFVADENSSQNLIFTLDEIIQANTTIPVILTNELGEPEYYRNIAKADKIAHIPDRKKYLLEKMLDMRDEHEPIAVKLVDANNRMFGTKYIYYEDSTLLVQLKYYPYVQLSVISLFVLVVFAVFNYSRLSEQNRVWVGLAKETAHQLGTPLSSLMAWAEYVKAKHGDDQNLHEIDKDIHRLEVITQRFSSIGSVPKLKSLHVLGEIHEAVDYLGRRLSAKVNFTVVESTPKIMALLDHDLFSWVLENICKNAVDAMKGSGQITINIQQIGKKVAVDITDTGHGIPRNQLNAIFKPGYSTKERGWGLGLALVKRIIEVYHNGRVFVRRSDKSGTTFRILLIRNI